MMRDFINIVSESQTPSIQQAKDFLFDKWRERAIERGRTEPTDLSSACKFGALFAKELFGGEIKANDFHTWVELNGQVIDLTQDSQEVQHMLRGEVPPSQLAYARQWGLEIPEEGIYTEDEDFMEDEDFIDSLKSCMPRVYSWVNEIMNK